MSVAPFSPTPPLLPAPRAGAAARGRAPGPGSRAPRGEAAPLPDPLLGERRVPAAGIPAPGSPAPGSPAPGWRWAVSCSRRGVGVTSCQLVGIQPGFPGRARGCESWRARSRRRSVTLGAPRRVATPSVPVGSAGMGIVTTSPPAFRVEVGPRLSRRLVSQTFCVGHVLVC